MSYETGQTDGTLLKWPGLQPLKPGTQTSPGPAARPKISARQMLNLLGPCLGLLLVVGLFSLSPTVRPFFLTGANFKIILTQTVIVAVGTLGMTIIIVSGGIDLSVGSVVALASVVSASTLAKGESAWLAAGLSVAVGLGAGLLNGLIIGGLRMMPF